MSAFKKKKKASYVKRTIDRFQPQNHKYSSLVTSKIVPEIAQRICFAIHRQSRL